MKPLGLYFWIVIILLSLAGCGKQNTVMATDNSSPACMCDPDALRQAVLDRIFEVGIGHQLYRGMDNTLETLTANQQIINRIWTYSKSLKDHCLKDAYANWASYYQAEHDDSVQQLKHPQKPKADTFAEEEKKKKRETEECKRRGIVPRLPEAMEQ